MPADIFAGIEDDIDLEVGGDDGATQAVSFTRLSKKQVRAVGGAVAGGHDEGTVGDDNEGTVGDDNEGTVGDDNEGTVGDDNDGTNVDTPPSNVEREGSAALHQREVDELDEEVLPNYRDEEDELDEYVAHRLSKKKNVYAGEDEEALSDGSSSSDSEDEYEEDAGALAGDGAMRGDMDAETQRLLREVATKDRLGKGQKVQIKALSGIVAKLQAKKAEVVGRAAGLRAPEAPTFDEIMGVGSGMEVEVKVGGSGGQDSGEQEDVEKVPTCTLVKGVNEGEAATTPATITNEKNENGGKDIAALFKKAAAVEAAKAADQRELKELEDEGALDIVEDGDAFDDGDVSDRIVELPKMRTPTKPSPLAFNLEYNKSAEMDDFEEKSLIDDGVGSDEDSDSESDHSWAVHEEKEGEEEGKDEDEDAVSGGSGGANDRGDEGLESDENAKGNAIEGCKNGDYNVVTFVRMKDNMKKLVEAQRQTADASKEPGHNRFLDEEAELSDDEGMGIAVSDDEDEGHAQDVDQNGELKDLIDASGKNLDKNNEAGEELHIKWARQQEAQQLKNILRGLENGFGRRGKGPLDDEDGGNNGRRRRARQDDDDDLDLDTAWPSLFGLGGAFGSGGGNSKDEDGEECEDEAVLRQAAQRKLVESQSERLFGSDGSFSVPLDEDSQHVLELFGNQNNTVVGSEDNAATGSNPLAGALAKRPSLKRLRSKDKTSSEPLSFIGRQSKVQRQTSKSNMGVSMNKTFVFGRVNASDSQMGTEDDANRENATQNTASQGVCGAIDFSGLKKELKSSQGYQEKNLLKTLPRWKQASDLKKHASGAVFDAVNSMIMGSNGSHGSHGSNGKRK